MQSLVMKNQEKNKYSIKTHRRLAKMTFGKEYIKCFKNRLAL